MDIGDGSCAGQSGRRGSAERIGPTVVIILCMVLVVVCFPRRSRADPVIDVGVELDYPPFEIVEEDGNPSGFAVELFKAVASSSHLDIRFEVGPWTELLADLRNGRIDVLPFVAISDDRATYLDFSVPILTTQGALFARKDGPSVSGKKDLASLHLLVMQDDIAHEFVRNRGLGGTVTTFPSLDAAFLALASGTGDAVVAPRFPGVLTSEKLGLEGVQPLAFLLDEMVLSYAFAVRKEQHALLAKLNGGLAKVIANGGYDRIFARWLTRDSGFTISRETALLAGSLLATLFGLVVSLLLLRQRRLAERATMQARINQSIASVASRLLGPDLPIEEVADDILACSKNLTGSPFGFVGYIDRETGYLLCPTMTRDIWEHCEVDNKSAVFKTFSGLWGWVLKNGQPLLTNDAATDPRSEGTPCGHIAITRFLSVPAIFDDGIVGQIAVANSSRLYTNTDLAGLEKLAALYAMALKRQQTETELRAAKNRALAANEAKGRFLAAMSHELRTPLNAILGFGEILQHQETDSGKRDQLRIINKAGNTLLRLINDLLDLSNIEAGRLAPETVSLAIRPIIEQAIQMFMLEADRKGIAIALRIAPGVPELVYGDPQLLRQILINLLSNAVRHTRNGRVDVEVEPTAQESNLAGPVLRFHVVDTGEGIRPENLDRIFELFEQEENPYRRRQDGAGLGLTISKRLVKLLGGRIWVESTPGQGSRFSFTIAFSNEAETVSSMRQAADAEANTNAGRHDQQSRVRRSELLRPNGGKRKTGKRILVIEDDPFSQLMVARLLENAGYVVDCATTGSEAEETLQTQSVDLVLLDIRLPDVPGTRIAEEIRAGKLVPARPMLPIIAMTAFTSRGERDAFLAAGVNDTIDKPFDGPSILASVNRQLEDSAAAA